MGSFGSHFIRFSACRRAAFTAWQEQSFSLSVQVSENDGLEVLKRTQMTQWCERSIRSFKIFQHKLVYTSVFERVLMDVIFPKTHEFEVSICTRILCNRASIGWFSASESSVLRWSGNGLLESGKQLQQQQHNNNTRKSLKVCMREGLEEERERESVANQHIWRKVGRKLLVISPQHITQHHIQMPQHSREQREKQLEIEIHTIHRRFDPDPNTSCHKHRLSVPGDDESIGNHRSSIADRNESPHTVKAWNIVDSSCAFLTDLFKFVGMMSITKIFSHFDGRVDREVLSTSSSSSSSSERYHHDFHSQHSSASELMWKRVAVCWHWQSRSKVEHSIKIKGKEMMKNS